MGDGARCGELSGHIETWSGTSPEARSHDSLWPLKASHQIFQESVGLPYLRTADLAPKNLNVDCPPALGGVRGEALRASPEATAL